MLETFDGSGASEAWGGRFGNNVGRRKRCEIRSPGAHAGMVANPVARLSFLDVLQYVRLRESGVDADPSTDPRRLNNRLLSVLTACHEVDTARQRLLGALGAQQTLDEIAHLLTARLSAGLCTVAQSRRLVVMCGDIGRSVEVATTMWDMASRHFTHVTRLLPSQLHGGTEGFAPLEQGELELLEQQAARLGAGDLFVHTRQVYRRALTDKALAQDAWTRAVRERQLAETRFRDGRRDVLAFAEAVVSQHWQANSLASRDAHSCMQRHTLYAVALMLPERLGLS